MTTNDLADELAIRNLVARYADAVTRRDGAALGATWADDGEWVVVGNTAKGRDTVVETFLRLTAAAAGLVQIANSGFVDLDGDTGTGRWYITEFGSIEGGLTMFNIGVYLDQYQRDGDGWRFTRREFAPLYMGPPDLSGAFQPFPEA